MSYNEEDTKLHLITPSLQAAGWSGQHLTMEYPITAGQIVLQGVRSIDMSVLTGFIRVGGTDNLV